MELTALQKFSISAADRKEWYRALSKIAADGLPIFDALDRMSKEFAKTKHPLGPLAEVVLMRMRGAGTAKAGAKRRTLGTELMDMVPDDEAMLIQAGEASGNHAAGLANAVALVEAKGKLRSSVTGALLKPVGYVMAMVGLLMFFSFKLMPQFEKTKPRELWPSSAQTLGSVADHVGLIVAGVVGFVLLTWILLQLVAPRWTGETRDKFDAHVFPFTVVAAINGASFLTSISGYVSAGTPFVTAIQNIESTANPYLRSQCQRALDLMKRGVRPEAALCDLPIVPQRFHWIISVYAMSGDAAGAYQTIAEEMVRSVQAFVDRAFGWVVSNLLLIMIGGMLFWIYSSMFEIALSGKAAF